MLNIPSAENMTRLYLALCVLVTVVTGYPHFRDEIPNGKKVPHPCKPNYVWKGVGHENELGGGDRNPFGKDWYSNGKKWDRCLCEIDSDGDGRTNGEELGDPDCEWSIGKAPATTQRLSHPGICEPLDDPKCRDINSWDINCDLEEFECPGLDDAGVEKTTAQLSSTPVPAEETTYICQFMDLGIPHDQEFHMIASEPYIDNEYVMHHLILYGCPDESVTDVRERFETPKQCGMEAFLCPTMIALWTVGRPGFCLAPEFGVRLGRNGFKYALIEMHWNNPELKSDYVDGSGITLHYTPNLRPNNGSTFFVGPNYLELLPGYKEITSEGHCPAECTKHMFAETVKIAAVIPHMHYLGRKMVVEQRRNGETVKVILVEGDYSYDAPLEYRFQPPVEIAPGDEIHVTCTFDTSANTDVVYFGEATSDEMCIAVVQYYPEQKNHSDCFVDNGIGSCNQFVGGDIVGPCYYSLGSFYNATGPFWSDYVPRMYGVCDPTGAECWPRCQSIIEELSFQECFKSEDTLNFFKNIYVNIDEVPREIINMLASCTERDDSWISATEAHDGADHGNGGVITDGTEGLCASPPSKGTQAQVSILLVWATLAGAAALKTFY